MGSPGQCVMSDGCVYIGKAIFLCLGTFWTRKQKMSAPNGECILHGVVLNIS